MTFEIDPALDLTWSCTWGEGGRGRWEVGSSFYISGLREQGTYKWWYVGDKQSLWVIVECRPLAGRRQP